MLQVQPALCPGHPFGAFVLHHDDQPEQALDVAVALPDADASAGQVADDLLPPGFFCVNHRQALHLQHAGLSKIRRSLPRGLDGDLLTRDLFVVEDIDLQSQADVIDQRLELD